MPTNEPSATQGASPGDVPTDPASAVTRSFDAENLVTRTFMAGPSAPSAAAFSVVVIPGYEILRELGRGGMGVVHEARDIRLNRLVAVKMILDRPGRSGTIRFRAEAEAMAAIRHPHVAAVYEAGEANGQPYLVMEVLPGGSLTQHLANLRGDLAGFVALFRKIATAVGAAHALGIVHRDLKPGNILFDENGEPKVTDFGLAKQGTGSDLTETGAIMGTPAYMAPEQASGQTKFVGPQADVWALGVILYEGLAGQRPFEGESAASILLASVAHDARPPRRINPKIPRDLELICLKCLAKAPHERYPTANELAEDLARYQRGEPISVRVLGPLERGWRWCRRYPTAAGLLLSLFLGTQVAIGLTVWALGERNRANEKAREAQDQAERAEQAKRNEAEQRKMAEQELARSLVAGVRELRVSRPLGWTWKGLDQLQSAYRLRPDALDAFEVRSLVAECLAAPDVRPIGTIGEGIDTVALAISPDSKRVAVAQWRNATRCIIEVYDPTDRQKRATYAFATVADSVSNLLAGKTQRYHDGVSALAFSPDGRWLVAGTRLGKLVRWDTTLEKPAAVVWRGHPDGETIHALCFSADGSYLVSTGDTDTKRWAVSDTGDWKGTRLCEAGWDLALSADGRFLAVAGDPVRVVVSQHLPPEELAKSLPTFGVAFSPDSRTLAAITQTELHLLDVGDNRTYLKIAPPEPPTTSDRGRVSFSPDGSLLCTVWSNNRVNLWEATTGKRVATLDVPDSTQSPAVRFSPDGRFLAITGHKKTYLYEVRPQSVLVATAPHPGPVRDIAFTRSGELVCHSDTLYDDRVSDSRVTLWNPVTGHRLGIKAVLNAFPERRFLPGSGGMALHPDGRRVAVVSSLLGPSLLAPGEPGPFPPLAQLPDLPRPVSVRPEELRLPAKGAELRDDPRSPTGRAVRLTPGNGDERVRFRMPDSCLKSKITTWGVVAAVRVERKTPAGTAIRFGVHADPDFTSNREVRSLRVPDEDYQWYFWEGTHVEQLLTRHTWMDVSIAAPDPVGEVEAVWVGGLFLYPIYAEHWSEQLKPTRTKYSLPQFSPSGDRLWAVQGDTAVVAWDVPGLRFALRWEDAFGEKLFGIRRVRALAVNQDWVLAGLESGEVQVLSASTGKTEMTWQNAGSGIQALAIHPTRPLAVEGTQQGQLRVVRVPGGELVAGLSPHQRSVQSIAFGRDGTLLATGSIDGYVKLWEQAGDGYQLVVTLPAANGELAAVRLSPDGRWLAIILKGDQFVRLWDLEALRVQFGELGLAR